MKGFLKAAACVLFGIMLSGCAETDTEETIPFEDGQIYAAAFLGYGDEYDLTPYEKYLDGETPSVYHISGGEYWLIMPRYDKSTVTIGKFDIKDLSAEDYKEPEAEKIKVTDGRPFIINCNISDIFPDAQISVAYEDDEDTFSPYISLKDGEVCIGEKGLDVTETDDIMILGE